eukprot:scaffold37281_cov45-Prasinocladus_malaysianus.AAC.1
MSRVNCVGCPVITLHRVLLSDRIIFLRFATLCRDYEAAWQELGVYLERGGGAEEEDDDSVRVLMERIRMSLEFGLTKRPDDDPINFEDAEDGDGDAPPGGPNSSKPR